VVSTLILLGAAVGTSVIINYVPASGRIEYVLAASLVTAYGAQCVVEWILVRMPLSTPDYISFQQHSEYVRWGINFLVIGGFGIAAMFYLQVQERKEFASREAATHAMVKEVELQKLQTQLQPHFLFNCLNSINAMIGLRPEEARQMVQQLSDFLRMTLKRADEHWISFSEELQYLENYLSIEKIRFGHRLDIAMNESEETKAWQIPTLLLQPLVENAIKFGLYGTTGKVTIGFEAWVAEDMLHIKVTNPFDQDAQPAAGSGFGLSGLRRRLYLLFGRNDLVETTSQNDVFTVILKIPAHK
jgi:LytS/YehU family sensor histidine kinase